MIIVEMICDAHTYEACDLTETQNW